MVIFDVILFFAHEKNTKLLALNQIKLRVIFY